MGARRVKKHENTRFLTKRAAVPSLPGKARILVVDDHPLVRHGISMLINRQDDLTCCQDEVDTVAGIIPAVKKDQPQMLLLDLNLKDGNSLNIIGTLREQFPNVPILVISQFDNILCAEDALHAGAVGYIMKEEATREILTAIRAVLRNETYISHRMDLPVSDQTEPRPQQPAVVEHLAEGELKVFLLLGLGMSVSDIAAQLKISDPTLETWRNNLKDKLNLPDDTALVNYALQCKRSFDSKNVDADAALFHFAVQLERGEWGKSPQTKPVQPEPPSGFSGN
jgi:DNA-binding NarL/FixJ family response regulator